MSTRTYEVETSITLDYRNWMWGLERLVLDGISNHLPADSGASQAIVRIKQRGEYRTLRDADFSKPVQEILFEDNGKGYDAGLLSILFSTKSLGGANVGQFGEGLKLIATAALRNGIDIEYRSRNWSAVPFKKPEQVDRNRIERLCFKITENGEYVHGSRTVFKNPKPELVETLEQLSEKVLYFNDSYQELHNERDNIHYLGDLFLSIYGQPKMPFAYKSRIVELDGKNSLYVKGVWVQNISSIFSYDLGTSDVTPDRGFVIRDTALRAVASLLMGCANETVIERVLRAANQNPDYTYYEFEAFRGPETPQPENRFSKLQYEIEERPKSMPKLGKSFEQNLRENLWVKTFRKIWGENAVIASTHNSNANRDAELMGYIPVRINPHVAHYLQNWDIKTADQIEIEQEYRWIQLDDLTESERDVLSKARDIETILLGEPIPLHVQVYVGLFTNTGREIKASKGVTMRNQEGIVETIGVKRETLTSLEEFINTYSHELGHYATGAADYTRAHTDFFTAALAKIIKHMLS